MMKKILAVAVMCMIILNLCACGGDNRDSSNNDTSETSTSETNTSVTSNRQDSVNPKTQDNKANTQTTVAKSSTTNPNTTNDLSEGDEQEGYNYKPYQVELDFDLVKEFPEAPVWDSEEAEEAFYSARLLEGYPDELKQIYNQKAINNELNDDEAVEFMVKGKARVFNLMYMDGQYVLNKAAFKKGENLLLESFDSSRSLFMVEVTQDGDLPKQSSINVDLPDGNTRLEVLSGWYDYTICYDTLSSEIVCLKYGTEIGERVETTIQEVKDFLSKVNGRSYGYPVGYIDSQNQLVYPIILKNSKGTSFYLHNVGECEEKEYNKEEPHFYVLKDESGAYYTIFNNSAYYSINGFTQEKGFYSAIGRCTIAFLEAENIEITEHEFRVEDLKNICFGPDDGWTDISGYFGNAYVTGSYTQTGKPISYMINENMFSQYIQEGNIFEEEFEAATGLDAQFYPKTYLCDNWQQALEIIDASNQGGRK